MPIEFRCSQCNQLLRVPDDAGGKSARCPKCQALMAVPAAGVAEVATGEAPGFPPEAALSPAQTDNPFASDVSNSPLSPASVPKFGEGGPNPYASPAAGAYAVAPGPYPGIRPGLPWETK